MNSKRLAAVCGLGACVLAAANPAAAQCNPEIEPINLRNAVSYDPLQTGDVIAQQDLRVVNNGTESCQFRLSVDDGASSINEARKGPSVLRITWLDQRNNPLAANAPSGVGPVVTVNPGTEATILARLLVPTGQLAPAGNYFASVNLQLIDANAASRVVLANELIDVGINVLPVASVALSGTQAGSRIARVDFGRLEEGETARVVFTTLTNSAYRLRFASQNAGVMRHESLEASVPYAFSVNGQAVDLRNEDNLPFDPRIVQRTSHDVIIRVGNVDGRPAGSYRDIVRMTIEPWR